MNTNNEKNKQLIMENLNNLKANIHKKYAWLNLSSNEEEELYQQALNRFLTKYTTVSLNAITKVLPRYLNNEYTLLIKRQLLNDSDNSFLELFTNNHLKLDKDPAKNERALLKYISLLQTYYPDISFESCLYLIEENTLIKNLINSVIYTNDKLNMSKLYSLLNTDLIILLDPFIEKNNLEVDSSLLENFESDSDFNYSNEANFSLTTNFKSASFSTDIVKDYLSNLPSKVLTAEEEQYYFSLIAKGDENAKEYVINHNLRLVIRIARRFLGHNIPLMDLIQEGNIGLMKAIEKFDYTKGYKFSTYATWWIRQAITRNISNYSRSIRLPVHVCETINKINKCQSLHLANNGSQASLDELSESLNMSKEKINEYLSYSQDILSLNNPVNTEEADSTLEDFLVDDTIDIEQKFIDADLQRSILPALEKLSPKERFVIVHRFGLNNEPIKTLQEVGALLKVTRERVRQIEVKALRKLRNNPKMIANKNYLDFDQSSNLPRYETKTTLFQRITSPKYIALKAIEYLSPAEKKYLRTLFGSDLSARILDIEDSELNYLIKKINFYSRALCNDDNIKITTTSLLNILDYTSQKPIEQVLSQLPLHDREIVQQKYPNLLAEPVTIAPPLEYYFNKIIIPKLKKAKEKLDHTNNTKNTTSSLQNALKNFTEEEQIYLRTTYLSTLAKQKLDILTLQKLIKETDDYLLQAYLEEVLAIKENRPHHPRRQTLLAILDTTIDQLSVILTSLSSDECLLLRKFYGSNYLEYPNHGNVTNAEEQIIYTQIIPKLKLALLNSSNPKKLLLT